MPEQADFFSARRSEAERRLEELRSATGGIDVLEKETKLCIYVTGSYGRLEASEHSDLDLFFIHDGRSKTTSFSQIDKTLLDADLIRLARKLRFPEFSGGGQYLAVHYLEDILRELGSPEDDHKNFFTARLLLLLESRPVHNDELYSEILGKIVESYYRDYHDHVDDFRPMFLTNDIIRFWKTLCLNYEHKRNRESSDNIAKNKSHLMNLKLKFSRLLTCFSAILMLSRSQAELSPEELVKLVRLSPLERLDRTGESSRTAAELVSKMKDEYGWFLHRTGATKDEQLEWIADRERRDDAFRRGREFAKSMYELLQVAAEGTDTMRFLVV